MKKKIFVSLLLVLIATAVCVTVSSVSHTVRTVALAEESTEPKTVLVLGLDGAACNSDVIILARYNPTVKQLTFLQIPRDTYLEDGERGGKINRFFATAYGETKDVQKAAERTCAVFSEAFGIKIDGCVALRFSALEEIVDALGGIPIHLPFPMEYTDPAQNLHISLPQGDTVLDGEAAVKFVRYRSGYTEGDLGRTDAQKLFLSAFLARLGDSLDVQSALSLLSVGGDGLSVSFEEKSTLLQIICGFCKNQSSFEKRYISAPGEAIMENGDSGTWYYVLNRDANQKLLKEFYGCETLEFDAEGRFCADKIQFENIYFDRGFAPRIYTEEELKKIKILTKE